MLKIGLTGGIGCGKTTVSEMFRELGAPIIDADLIAHQIVAPGQPALQSLEHCFGEEIIRDDGSLDRQRLSDIVFSQPAQKQRLEKLLHPIIEQEMHGQLQALDDRYDYCILSIPLLIEKNLRSWVDRVLVIDCPAAIQRQRVLQRDRHSLEHVDRIIASQASRQERLAQADDIIDNSNSPDRLADQVKKLHNQYLNRP